MRYADLNEVSKTYYGTTIKTQGLRRASRALNKAADSAEDQRQLMYEIGEVVAAEARTLVPVRTGRIRDSIRSGRGKTKAVVRAGFKTVPYAPVIHYGWADHNIEPQPYMLQALLNKREEVVRVYKKGMERLLFEAGLDPSTTSVVKNL